MVLLQAGVAGHFGLAKSSELLNEYRHLRHSTLELQYLDLLALRQSSESVTDYFQTANTSSQPLVPFSRYDDRSGYAGKVISPQWLVGLVKAYDLEYGRIMDRVILSGSGTVLAGDASYKVRFLIKKHGFC